MDIFAKQQVPGPIDTLGLDALRKQWVALWGDPADPETRAKIDRTVAALALLTPTDLPFRPAGRDDVYRVIDGERAYQDAQRGTAKTDRPLPHPVAAELLMLERYIGHARTAWVDNPGDLDALHQVRKVAAIAVRCLEVHGAPKRSIKPE